MPIYNGKNGIVSHGDDAAGFSNESLSDWTKKPDFVAVSIVRSASILWPNAGEDWGGGSGTTKRLVESDHYGALQHIEIQRVLWRNSAGIAAPDSFDMVNLGWRRNSDTGVVSALLPENGPRLDVGDTFVAAFFSDHHRFDAKFQATQTYRNMPAHWGIFNDQGAIEVVNGKLVTDDRTVAYERPLAGLTVDAFKQKLLDSAVS